MALVTDRVVVIEGVGYVEITYDDALAVSHPTGGMIKPDITNCDLESVRVVVFDGVDAKYRIGRGTSQVFREGTIIGPFDQTFNAGGPVKKTVDLTSWGFGAA